MQSYRLVHRACQSKLPLPDEERRMEPGIELYSAKLCPFAHRTRLTLAEKGVKARVIEVDLRNKPPSFAALSPQGEVPVLKIGDTYLTDSAVIDEYLEEVLPDPALLPADPALRARARYWIRFADRRLYPSTKRLLLAVEADARGAALAAVREDLLFLQRHAFGADAFGPYWMGARLTLVDLTYVPWFEQSPMLEAMFGFTWPPGTAPLRQWYEHVAARPAVAVESRGGEFYIHEYGLLARQRQVSTDAAIQLRS
jgi:glutathione S-transferase